MDSGKNKNKNKKKNKKQTNLFLFAVTNAWRYTLLSSYLFVAWCLMKHRDIVTFVINIAGALVEALRYKPEDRGFDSRWCHWNFLLI